MLVTDQLKSDLNKNLGLDGVKERLCFKYTRIEAKLHSKEKAEEDD